MGSLRSFFTKLFYTPVVGGRMVMTDEEEILMNEATQDYCRQVLEDIPDSCNPKDIAAVTEQLLDEHLPILDKTLEKLKECNVSAISIAKPAAYGCREGVRRTVAAILGCRSVLLPAIRNSPTDTWELQLGSHDLRKLSMTDVLLFLMLDHSAFGRALIGRPTQDRLEYPRDIPEVAWIEDFRDSELVRDYVDHFDSVLRSDPARLSEVRDDFITAIENVVCLSGNQSGDVQQEH